MRILKDCPSIYVDIAIRTLNDLPAFYVDTTIRIRQLIFVLRGHRYAYSGDYTASECSIRRCSLVPVGTQPQSFNLGSNYQCVGSMGVGSRVSFGGNSLLATGNINK
jgi:hypothetical protein